MAKKLTTEEFIKKAREIHGNKYDYSKVNYINNYTKVCIICKEHGEFWQTPNNHLNGKGCKECAKETLHNAFSLTKEEFIKKAKEIHGDKYDYSKVDYVNYETKVSIICPKHGEFLEMPLNHLKKHGCKKCAYEISKNKKSLTVEEFIKKAKAVHGDKYDYSKVKYKNSSTKVCIICPIHGEFWITPDKHMYRMQGCNKCNISKLETEIELYLQEQNIKFEWQKKFDWLGQQSLDFYLPEYNCGIECQGIQHFQQVSFFGGENEFRKIIERDKNKQLLCKEHNLKLFYFSNLGLRYPYKVYEKKEKLLQEIIKK